MSYISAIEVINFPHKVLQKDLKEFASNLFSESFKDIDRLLEVFDNTGISNRNLCVPIDFFSKDTSFKEKNNLFKKYALDYSVKVIENLLSNSNLDKSKITDIIYFTSTGLTTPSLDALIIDKLKLNPNINRTPLWGLGCAAGVSAMAKAKTFTDTNPDAVILLIGVELCSLTFIRNDLSKSNFIATSLFSDGIAAAIVTGKNSKSLIENKFTVEIKNSRSKIYPNSEDVMGWEFVNAGFKVVFSKDIPNLVNTIIKEDILKYLTDNNLSVEDIKNFVIHPGGTKVINAYVDSLGISRANLKNTSDTLHEYGNMSSVTVLYVLNKFMNDGIKDGPGLMMSLGPGFSCEMLLLDMKNVS
ncbi:MAG: type III polyketide synthase [Bacteroidetes bacterium]|nr:type III polyketide synthase [Bacteroidota bacterium]